jgi:hypothetical protein
MTDQSVCLVGCSASNFAGSAHSASSGLRLRDITGCVMGAYAHETHISYTMHSQSASALMPNVERQICLSGRGKQEASYVVSIQRPHCRRANERQSSTVLGIFHERRSCILAFFSSRPRGPADSASACAWEWASCSCHERDRRVLERIVSECIVIGWKHNKKVSVVMICSPIRGTLEGAIASWTTSYASLARRSL